MEGQISELNLDKIMDCEGNYVKVRWGKGISLTNPIIPVAAQLKFLTYSHFLLFLPGPF